jgi:4-amino-4-deoxy-L-arabinose transferase-like glycosyltransferase
MFKLFGISNISATIYPLFCSLGTILLAYFGGRLLFNSQTGLISALLLCFYPLNVLYASWIMPDIPVEFFMSLGIILFLFIYKKGLKVFYLYIVGVLFGIVYLINIRSIVCFFTIIPFFLIWFRKKKFLQWALLISLFLGGFLTVFTLEGIYNLKRANDFFLNYHRTTQYYSAKNSSFLKAGINNRLSFYPKLIFNLDDNLQFMKRNTNWIYGYFFYLFCISVLFLLSVRKREIIIPLWWFLSLFLYMQFGSMSLNEYIPIHRLDRHLTIISIPMVIICGAFLACLVNSKVRIVGLAIIFFLFGSSLIFTKAIADDMRAPSYDMKEIFNFLKDYPGKDIYADPGVLDHLQFYFKFKDSHLRHDIRSTIHIKPDSFVVLDGTRGFIENPSLIKMLPRWARIPDPSWKLVKTIRGPKIGIYATFDPKIYHVP